MSWGWIAEHFEQGGPWMWPILVLSIVVWGITVERFVYLFFKASVNAEVLVGTLQRTILGGELQKAILIASNSPSPLARIVHAGLLKVKGDSDEVQAAMDEAALRELPRVEKRTAYLAMLANVAMLVGLLGTISGMITSFAAVANAEASEKAAELAKGIAEAMNCTAFGLITAVPALLFYAILQGKTQSIVDEINEGSLRVVNFVLANRSKL